MLPTPIAASAVSSSRIQAQVAFMVPQKRWQTDSARELERVGAALGSNCGSWAAGLRSGVLQPLSGPHDLILPAARPPSRSRQQEHHRCRFGSGIRMFILFSGSPRLLRQSGCQSAPRVLEFGLKPSLPGANILHLLAPLAVKRLGSGNRATGLRFSF